MASKMGSPFTLPCPETCVTRPKARPLTRQVTSFSQQARTLIGSSFNLVAMGGYLARVGRHVQQTSYSAAGGMPIAVESVEALVVDRRSGSPFPKAGRRVCEIELTGELPSRTPDEGRHGPLLGNNAVEVRGVLTPE
jgi:hypothetical protein